MYTKEGIVLLERETTDDSAFSGLAGVYLK
jgi:hypothetical protein